MLLSSIEYALVQRRIQVTHKVEADTDTERDFIVASLRAGDPTLPVQVIEHFSSGFHARNGGGDLIETDGALPVVGVGPSPDPPEAAAAGRTDSRDRRPAQTVFGAGVALVRCLLFVLAAVAVLVAPGTVLRLTHQDPDLLARPPLPVLLAAFLVVLALVELGLGLATLAGRNWARLCLMTSAALTTCGVGTTRAATDEPAARALLLGLPATATAILVLLALSSHRARDYAARDRTRTPSSARGENTPW